MNNLELHRESLNLLKSLQYSTRVLGDGCETCGYGATKLKECPMCDYIEPWGEGHRDGCELYAHIKRLELEVSKGEDVSNG